MSEVLSMKERLASTLKIQLTEGDTSISPQTPEVNQAVEQINRYVSLEKLFLGACKLGSLSWARVFYQYSKTISHPLDVNYADSRWGWTPLIYACAVGNPSLVRFLLDTVHVHVNVTGNNGVAPIHIAARKGCIATLRILLHRGAKLKSFDYADRTALHYATNAGQESAIRYLLYKGAAVDQMSSYGTPLHIAALCGMTSICKFLIASNANISALTPSVASGVLGEDHPSIVGGETPLNLACSRDHADTILLLLEHEVASDIDGNTLVHLAAKRQCPMPLLQNILEKNLYDVVRPNLRGKLPYQMMRSGKQELFDRRQLLSFLAKALVYQPGAGSGGMCSSSISTSSVDPIVRLETVYIHILGSTGSGKTCIGQYLAAQLARESGFGGLVTRSGPSETVPSGTPKSGGVVNVERFYARGMGKFPSTQYLIYTYNNAEELRASQLSIQSLPNSMFAIVLPLVDELGQLSEARLASQYVGYLRQIYSVAACRKPVQHGPIPLMFFLNRFSSRQSSSEAAEQRIFSVLTQYAQDQGFQLSQNVITEGVEIDSLISSLPDAQTKDIDFVSIGIALDANRRKNLSVAAAILPGMVHRVLPNLGGVHESALLAHVLNEYHPGELPLAMDSGSFMNTLRSIVRNFPFDRTRMAQLDEGSRKFLLRILANTAFTSLMDLGRAHLTADLCWLSPKSNGITMIVLPRIESFFSDLIGPVLMGIARGRESENPVTQYDFEQQVSSTLRRSIRNLDLPSLFSELGLAAPPTSAKETLLLPLLRTGIPSNIYRDLHDGAVSRTSRCFTVVDEKSLWLCGIFPRLSVFLTNYASETGELVSTGYWRDGTAIHSAIRLKVKDLIAAAEETVIGDDAKRKAAGEDALLNAMNEASVTDASELPDLELELRITCAPLAARFVYAERLLTSPGCEISLSLHGDVPPAWRAAVVARQRTDLAAVCSFMCRGLWHVSLAEWVVREGPVTRVPLLPAREALERAFGIAASAPRSRADSYLSSSLSTLPVTDTFTMNEDNQYCDEVASVLRALFCQPSWPVCMRTVPLTLREYESCLLGDKCQATNEAIDSIVRMAKSESDLIRLLAVSLRASASFSSGFTDKTREELRKIVVHTLWVYHCRLQTDDASAGSLSVARSEMYIKTLETMLTPIPNYGVSGELTTEEDASGFTTPSTPATSSPFETCQLNNFSHNQCDAALCQLCPILERCAFQSHTNLGAVAVRTYRMRFLCQCCGHASPLSSATQFTVRGRLSSRILTVLCASMRILRTVLVRNASSKSLFALHHISTALNGTFEAIRRDLPHVGWTGPQITDCANWMEKHHNTIITHGAMDDACPPVAGGFKTALVDLCDEKDEFSGSSAAIPGGSISKADYSATIRELLDLSGLVGVQLVRRKGSGQYAWVCSTHLQEKEPNSNVFAPPSSCHRYFATNGSLLFATK